MAQRWRLETWAGRRFSRPCDALLIGFTSARKLSQDRRPGFSNHKLWLTCSPPALRSRILPLEEFSTRLDKDYPARRLLDRLSPSLWWRRWKHCLGPIAESQLPLMVASSRSGGVCSLPSCQDFCSRVHSHRSENGLVEAQVLVPSPFHRLTVRSTRSREGGLLLVCFHLLLKVVGKSSQ